MRGTGEFQDSPRVREVRAGGRFSNRALKSAKTSEVRVGGS